MNVIRLLRNEVGITQQALADRAGTSQSTIAFYERGAKSPTLTTLQKLASSVGLELVFVFTPPLTREDQRSLVYHGAVAKILRESPAGPIKRARRTLKRMSEQHSGPRELFRRWGQWLRLPTEEMISKIRDPGVLARDMRQVSPFAGLIPPRERAKLLVRFRKEYVL